MPRAEDDIQVKDNVRLILRDRDGKIIAEREGHNVVTTKGREGYADQVLASPTLGKPTHIAIGKKSTTAEAESNTALDEESKRIALTSKSRSAKVVTYKGLFAAGEGTGEVKETGIFDAESVGNMWARFTFAVINKGAEDTLEVIWKHNIG